MECRWPPLSFLWFPKWVNTACATSFACVWPSRIEVRCLEVWWHVLDLSNWNANTTRIGSGPFFFIYPSGVPKVVELRDYISSTKLTGKYYSISAIEVLPAPQLVIFQPHLGRQHVSLANWLFLFTMFLFLAPTLPFPCPISLSYLFAHGLLASKGSGKFCGPKPNTDGCFITRRPRVHWA